MSKIAQSVQEFLNAMEWGWQERAPNRYSFTVPSPIGQWGCTMGWEEDDSLFTCYTFSPLKVPPGRRAAAGEYLHRANFGLRRGCFEMDYADGEVRCRTDATTEHVEPGIEFIKSMAYPNFSLMERYLPGLMAVAFGGANPAKAIRQAERPRAPRSRATAPPQGQAVGPFRIRRPPPSGLLPKRRGAPSGSDTLRTRRVAQLARYLRMMGRRMHEARRHCFLVLSNRSRDKDHGAGGQSAEPERMVQFCFQKDWFAVDVPNTVIEPEAAKRVLGERTGFFRQAEAGGAGITTEVKDLEQFDPIGKKYVYGDEREAAEDAAYLLFTVAGVPLGSTLYVTASAFGDGPEWEKDEPLG